MKSPNITPGPWRARLDRHRVGWFRHEIVIGEGNQVVAEVIPHPLSLMNVDTENEKAMAECAAMGHANARAIAAVPQLLAALEDCLSVVETSNRGYGCPPWNEEIKRARAALLSAGYTE